MASRRSLKKQSIILQNWQQDSVWWNQQTQMQKTGSLQRSIPADYQPA